MIKVLYVTVFLLSSLHTFGQLSAVHYLPPLKQGRNNQAIRQQAFYLSTPETTAFDVVVYQGVNPVPIATITNVSNTTPQKYTVANGDNNITLVKNGNTGVVLNNSGLRFESTSGQKFYVNYRARSGAQATSLTSKGQQALGTSFKWGGRPNYGNGHNSLNATLGIMATEDNTVIHIFDYGSDCEFRLQGDDDGLTSDSLTIRLNKGQTYVLEARRNATAANIDCWLGATIQSNQLIAISNGNLNGAPRAGANSRDAVIDQPVPENVLGREYIFIRGNGINDIETPIIIGTQNGTDLFVNGSGTPIATINTGEYYVIHGSNYSGTVAGSNMLVTSSKEVYAYQHLSGSSGIQTGGLNFIAPVNCLLPDELSTIANIRDVDGLNFNGGITITASTTTPDANITVTDGNGNVTLPASIPVIGTADWKTFYVPGLSGNVSVNSTGPIAVGFLGVNTSAGLAGYFSGFDTIPEVELEVSGGGCLPGSDVFEITNNFDAYQWFENGMLIPGETTNTYTPSTPGDFFVRVTRGSCTYDSSVLSVYNCDPEIVLKNVVDNALVLEGDTVTFTITVEHLGIDPVSNLVIAETLPPELTLVSATPTTGSWTVPNWTIGDMYSGELHTLTVVATVNELSEGTTVTNVINNTQDQVELNTVLDDPTEDVAIMNSEIAVTTRDRTAVDGSYDTVGELITYDFTVTNTGDTPLTNVTIIGSQIDTGSLSPASIATLPIGASVNFTATHTITQADIDANQVINSVTGHATVANGFMISDLSDDPDDPTTTTDDPTVVPIVSSPNMTIIKFADDNSNVTENQRITYTYIVTNTNNVTIDEVSVSDIHTGTGVLGVLTLQSTTGTDDGVDTIVDELGPGEMAIWTAEYTITATDIANQTIITSTAIATGSPRSGNITAPTAMESVTVNPIATHCGGITLAHDLTADVDASIVSFSWSAAVNSLVVGETTAITTTSEITDTLINRTNTIQEVVYTILGFDRNSIIQDVFTYSVTLLPAPTVFNNFKQTICSGASINRNLINDVDNFNANVTFSWSAVDNPNIIGETTSVSTTTSITDILINTSNTIQTVEYTIIPTSSEGCLGNAYTYTVSVSPQPELIVTKVALPALDGAYDTLGEHIRYQIEVVNPKEVEITNVTLSDMNVDMESITPRSTTIAAFGRAMFTATHQITQTDLDAGQIENTAVVNGQGPCEILVSDLSDDPNTTIPNDPTITQILQHPSIRLVKTANLITAGTTVHEGDQIEYTFTVTNTGSVTVQNLMIKDLFFEREPFFVTPSVLLPGAQGIATALYTITQADLNAGEVWNSAMVIGQDLGGNDIIDISDNGDELVDEDGDSDPGNDMTITILPQQPNLALTKSGVYVDANFDGIPNVGDEIQYTFTITNTGNIDLTSVTIADDLTGIVLSGTEINLDVGRSDSTTFTGIYTLQERDLFTGQVANQAIATGFLPDGSMVNDLSDDPTDLTNLDIDGDRDGEDKARATIDLEEDFVVYTGMSPNGDGVNDQLRILGLQKFPENTLRIYNRWGVIVFEENGYEQPGSSFFKGVSKARATVQGEETLPVGVYYYMIMYTNETGTKQMKSGYLYINK